MATTKVGQSIAGGTRLVWWESFWCDACGAATETDNRGFLPEAEREALINADGLWEVVVGSIDDQVVVAKTMRRALGLGLEEALVASRKIPGCVWSGTEVEAKWLVRELEVAGIDAVVKTVGSDP
jgi:ribosomal protein L7/L12